MLRSDEASFPVTAAVLDPAGFSAGAAQAQPIIRSGSNFNIVCELTVGLLDKLIE